jgi:hypothetical protein
LLEFLEEDGLRERELNQFWDNRLWSYYFWITEKKLKTDKNIKIFLDSGAFSAFTKGVSIDINEYINFIKQYQNHLEIYANLDVIGDPEATLKNQKIMEEADLSPLPCFHYGEPIKYLKQYIQNYDYIALGGMVPISSRDLTIWLDDLFSNHIPPNIKIHGFGLTSLKLLIRYPWYSVDSTSWCMTGRMGSIYVPRKRDNKYLYDENSWKICVSNRSPDKTQAGKHIDTFTPVQSNTILEYLNKIGYKLGRSDFFTSSKGYKLEENERWFGKAKVNGDREVEKIINKGLSNDYKLRDEVNIIYFLDLEKALPKWPWEFKKKGNTGFGL